MKFYLHQLLWFPWTLWCGIVFVVALILAFPILLFVLLSRNERLIYKAHFLPPLVARMLLFLWGIRIKEINRQYSVGSEQTIFISNHRSYLDGLVGAAVIPNFTKFLGKGELLYWPVLGLLMKYFYVPVWRQDKKGREWSMDEMRKKLSSGASFFICPEGTCNTSTNFLNHFHTGAFRLALENKLPVVPFTFIGTGELFPRKGLLIKPGTVIVYWHKPIPTDIYTLEDVDSINTICQQVMRKDLLENYPEGKFPDIYGNNS